MPTEPLILVVFWKQSKLINMNIYVKVAYNPTEERQENAKKVVESIFSDQQVNVFTTDQISELDILFDLIFISGTAMNSCGGHELVRSKLYPNGKIIGFSCDDNYLCGKGGLYETTDYAFWCWEFSSLKDDEKEFEKIKKDCLELITSNPLLKSESQIAYFSKVKKEKREKKIEKGVSIFVILVAITFVIYSIHLLFILNSN